MNPNDRDFRLLFEKNPLAMWVFDAGTLKFLAVNDAAVTHYGYSPEEFEGMTIADLRFPEDLPAMRLTLERFKHERTGTTRKWRHRTRNGQAIYVDVVWNPVIFGGQQAVLATVIDMSGQDLRAKEVWETQERFTYVAQAVSDAFWDWDLKTNLVWWSDGMRAIFRYRENEVDPHFNWWYQRIHPDDRDRVVGGLEDAFRSARNLWEDEYRYRRADGSYASVIDRGYIIRGESGSPERMVGTLMDITRRKQTEEIARLYGDIFRNIQIGLYVFRMEDLDDDTSFRVIAANPAAERITAIPAADILGKSLESCFGGLRAHGFPQMYAEVIRTGKEVDFDDITYGDDRVPLSHYTARFFPLPGQCVGVAFEDISVRFQAEEKLRRVENRFQILAAVLPVGIYQNDASGKCIYVNQKCCELCGVEREDLIGVNWARSLHPEDRRRITNRWQSTVRRKAPFQAEYRFKRPDGTVVWVLGQAVPEYDDAGEFVGFIGSITDITERKRLENEILSISGQEQQRIGQALHDRLGQHLTGIAFLAKALAQKLNALQLEEASSAEEVATLINQAILRTRDLARMLHPVELAENGLVAALQDLVSNAGRMFKISCQFVCDQAVQIEDKDVATHLYHIAQEAITNAVKHGHATVVTVELGQDDTRAYLKVDDNGDGIPQGYQNSPGIGLRIMKHRTAMIDGELHINRSAHGGTLLTCSFIVPETQTAGENA